MVDSRTVVDQGISLENVTGTRFRVFSPQDNAVPKSELLRFSELPQLAALPLSTSDLEYEDMGINQLNDDILLDIINCYRLDEKNGWNDRLGWRQLSHVCQRWRHLILESAFHLGILIECTNGTPIADTLDHLPPLPLLVNYRETSVMSGTLTMQDRLGIYHALRLPDRVRNIALRLPPSTLHECIVLMNKQFPILEHLSLSFATDHFTTPMLPKTFVAPNLRHLLLSGIRPLKRLRLLTSTVSLVTLVLSNIQTSSYFRPRLLVARLRSLPQLEGLSIYFSVPIPRPSAERELLGEQRTPATLPELKTLAFQGISAYLESLVAQIRAPVLERLEIALFNQIAFALPHLSHLMHVTEGFKVPAAKISFDSGEVSIIMAHHSSQWSEGSFFLRVMCKELDWQIDCVGQICGALIPILSKVEQLTLYFHERAMPTEWQNGEIDGTTWHELLRSFIGVKQLHIADGLLEEVSRALQADESGLDPGFLPSLLDIVAAANFFVPFINTRRVMGRPVQYLGRTRPRRPPGLRLQSPQPLPPLESLHPVSSMIQPDSE